MKTLILVLSFISFSQMNHVLGADKNTAGTSPDFDQRRIKAQKEHDKLSREVVLTTDKVHELEEQMAQREIQAKNAEAEASTDREELGKLKDQASLLQKRLGKATATKTTYENDILKMKQDYERLTVENKQSEKKLHQTEEVLEQRKTEAEKQRANLNEQSASLKNELQTLQRKVDEQEDQVKQSEVQLKNLKKDIGNSIDLRSDLFKRTTKAESTRAKLGHEMEGLKQDYERLQAESKVQEAKLGVAEQAAQSKQADAEKTRAKYAQQSATLKNEVKTLEAQTDQKEKAAKSSVGLAAAGKEEIETLLSQKAKLEKRSASADAIRAKEESQIQSLHQDYSKLSEEVKVKESKVHVAEGLADAKKVQADKEAVKHQEDITKLKTELQAAEQNLAQKESAVKAAEELLASDKKEIEKAKDRKAQLLKLSENADQARAQVEAQYRPVQRERQQLLFDIKVLETRQKASDTKRQDFEKQRAGYSDELTTLRTQLSSLEQQAQLKESQAKSAEGVAQAGKAEIYNSKLKRAELIKRIEMASARKAKLDGDIKQLHQEYNRTSAETKQLKRSVSSVPSQVQTED